MIDAAVDDLRPLIGEVAACQALGACRSGRHRRRRPTKIRVPRPRAAPDRALSEAERAAVLAQLHSPRFIDASPAEVYATLLDEGVYLASERTMYRLLAANGPVRDRRDQLTHPPSARPELLAERPNELWSWDIRQVAGPVSRATGRSKSTRPPPAALCSANAVKIGSNESPGYPRSSLRASSPSSRRRCVSLPCSHAMEMSSAREPN